MSILHITSSANPAASNSSMLGGEAAAHLGGTTATRDTNDGIPHLTPDWVAANFTPTDDRTAEQKAQLALSDTLVAELQAADTLILSLPVYNFGVPSTLKAWIDHICRAGVTFSYSEDGPIGLLTGKRAVIVAASGGMPVGSDMDFATSYLRFVLGFVGITDVTLIAADRVMAQGDARTTIAAL
jgi:FMN-dependent NADH-azoreductase